MPKIEANNIEVNCQIGGADSAPAILFSNSLGTNLHMWDSQAKDLSGRFRVIRYDTRGHGKTSAPEGPYTVEQLGRDAIAFLDALKLRKVFFCGLSMGGMIGMWLARHAPERIEKLVISNTAAKFGLPDAWNQRITAVRAGGMKPITDGILERWFTKAFRETARDVESVKQMLHTTPAPGYVGNCAAVRDVDQRWTIGDIKVPTLVIGGKQDPATPFAAAEFIASRIPGAKLLGLDAAHLSNLEKPAEFTKAVGDFFSKG